MTSKNIQTAVVGVGGYAGLELAKLLLHHPRLGGRPPVFFGREHQAEPTPVAALHPQLAGHRGAGDLRVEPISMEAFSERGVDLVFLATPHEQSREWVPQLLRRGVRVVDLSGAWRLNDPANRAVYKFEDADAAAAAEVQRESVYGMPELHRDAIRKARVVANPGCYPTSIILALKPLVACGWVDTEHGIICDSKSGVSGAGKAPTAKTHYMAAADNLSAYAVYGHRHTGELLEQLDVKADQITFTPHLLPVPRGILSTIYVNFTSALAEAEVEECYRSFFAASPLVRFFGRHLPQIQYSAYTNYCDIGIQLSPDRRRAVIVSCLDNLLKGAAGQAVQNMNLMYGWEEAEGLA